MQECTKTEQEETDSLMDLIRSSSQQLLAQVLKAEVADLLAPYADQKDEQRQRGSCTVAIIQNETFRQEFGQ